jgi:DNA-binding response OmpR family regulator
MAVCEKPVVKRPITTRTLLARINRKLAHSNEAVRKCREGSHGHANLGDYYLLDLYTNTVRNSQIDLEHLARELQVLHEFEQVS